MFNKYQNIFRSRWKALWWAAGVLLTAYCTVPSQSQKDMVPTVKLSTVTKLLHPAKKAPPKPDPWGYDSHERPVRPQ
jgi:hypothetical protein